MSKPNEPRDYRTDTRVVTAGRTPREYHGFVNPPVYHGSTVLYPTAADMVAHRARYRYGRRGTPTSEALENALRELEGPQCAGVALLPSGAAAVSTALLSVLSAGDHLLITDSVYRPTRTFADSVLKRYGVETSYYDPLIGADIAGLFKPNTRAVFVEAPGSQTFEMQDIPAIARVAHDKGAVVLMDNTWATPLYFQAFAHGVDLSIQAGTKYIGGHSDIMFGTVSANAATWPQLNETVGNYGLCAGPDDVYLAQRGLRTMSVRLERHQRSALEIAQWFEQRPEVLNVLYPALPSHPGHAIWKRDFTGASGLFSIVLKPVSEKALYAFCDALSLFGMGFSWGGYESLVIIYDCTDYRTATSYAPGGLGLRFHIGLEDTRDLIADLERGFAALHEAERN
ncbi:cystathionine beta-lyase [Pseudorhodoplanes sp.]|uniref:cystathionine beta-lyase n=1 Tax=Pseudorhodoplanes sp. TaxID=1934341 RepID=UPI002CF9EE50|nr:cystathionine beta-lyase [Pseudorhodoplanes sp.]HWV53154.1 cystathionine beta-lyase [Pseudorhodoplanes sp.]